MKKANRLLAGALCVSLLLSQGILNGTAADDGKQEVVLTTEEHISLAREAAAEGMVLLENDGALPLREKAKVALFGCGQIRFQKGGGGSGDVNTLYTRSLLDGMQIKEEEGKLSLYQPLVDAYQAYTAENTDGELSLSQEQVDQAARESQTAVVTISRYSQEGVDRNSGQGDYYLSAAEEALLEKVQKAGFRKTVVVLNIGGVIDTSWFEEYDVDAVLVAWQAGMEGGLAAADILCGDVNPSGKLTDTFAASYDDYPCADSFNESARGDYMNHTDDIFVGYRYFETIPGAAEKVLYPFGYGLSYTDFSLSAPKIEEKDGKITVEVDVQNTGEMAGKEVVQVYFSAPQRNDTTVFLDKAAKELIAFGKTGLLEPGETETVTLSFAVNEMASYDDDGKTGKKSAYVLEPGDYNIYVGNSIRDAGDRGVRYTHTQESLEVTEQLTEQLTAHRLEKRLRWDGTYEELDLAVRHDLSADGATQIEGEDYSRASKDVRVEKIENGNTEGRCIAGLSGGSVEFDLHAPAAGSYRVTLRMSNGLGPISDAFQVYVDDTLQPNIQVDLPVTGSGQWYNFTDINPFIVTLPAGDCTLRFVAAGNCGNMDYLTLAPANENEHLVSPAGKTLVEAAESLSLDPNARVEDYTENGGGSCVADLSGLDRFVSYGLYATEAGVYQVTLQAANGQGAITDMLRVYVDDQLQPDVFINLPNTSVEGNPWHNYVDAEPFTITLPAGSSVLKLVSNGTCANLGSFTLEKLDTSGHPVSAMDPTLIQAEDFWELDLSRAIVEDFDTEQGKGSCVSNLSDAGTYVTYKLQVATAGTYRVTLRAANGWGRDLANMMQVYVDDQPVSGVSITVPPTSVPGNDWFSFVDVDPFTVILPQGATMLKLVSNGTCANLDSLTLEPADIGGHEVSPDGQTVIQAEDFEILDPGAKTEDFEVNGSSGTCLSSMGGGRYVTYRLRVEEAGLYQVTLNAANGWGEIQDMLKVFVDGKQQPGVSIKMPGTGVDDNLWFNFVDVDPFYVYLPRGVVTLKLMSNGDCANLNAFTLEKYTAPGQPVSATETTAIEAENFLSLDPGAKTEDFKVNDSSGTCVSNLAGGHYVSYQLQLEQAGNYNLILNAANNWGDIPNMLKVYVNGRPQTGVIVNMPNTAVPGNDWFNFVELDPISLTLPAGAVTLTLVSVGDKCANLDSFTLEPAAAIQTASHIRMRAGAATVAAVESTAETENMILLKDVYEDPDLMSDFLAQMSVQELSALASGQPSAIRWNTGGFGNLAQYGIPNSQMLDGPAGIHTYELTTAWPVATLLACTWNEELLERIGRAVAEEGIATGADIWLAPALNIHRNILCGRNFEYYSEDPLVSGKMAAAIAKGAQAGGLGVAIKHFAVNNRENNRNDIDSRVSERALREIYLEGFRICVQEANPWTVMSSYNFLNGQETSESYSLLTTILREEWGFDGLVMTDWGNNSFFWREIKAGNNLKMPSGDPNHLVQAVEQGQLTRAELEANAAVILETLMKTHTFKERVLSPSYLPVSAYGTTRIQAVDYAWISSGIRPETCQDPESFQDLGALNEQEWIEYNLQVERAGDYQVAVRLAAFGGGSFDIYLDGQKVGTFQNTLNTGDWQSWQTAEPFTLSLPEGQHTLKLVITQSGMNLQWLSFTSPYAAYTVSGRVAAGDTGLADLSGITVKAYAQTDADKAHCLAQAVTDATGAFTLDNVLPTGAYRLCIDALDGAYKAAEIPVTVADADITDLLLTLEAETTPPVLVQGDLDKDGEVTIADVMEACKVMARESAGTDPTDDEIARGDLDKDGEITIADVMEICKILARGQ